MKFVQKWRFAMACLLWVCTYESSLQVHILSSNLRKHKNYNSKNVLAYYNANVAVVNALVEGLAPGDVVRLPAVAADVVVADEEGVGEEELESIY
jgi:magnesium-transporting ATPase (P-type)